MIKTVPWINKARFLGKKHLETQGSIYLEQSWEGKGESCQTDTAVRNFLTY